MTRFFSTLVTPTIGFAFGLIHMIHLIITHILPLPPQERKPYPNMYKKCPSEEC